MAQTKPMLRFLLPGLTATVALALTATLFSGNALRFFNSWFNDWDWFNGSFNRTVIHPAEEASKPDGEPETQPRDQPHSTPISVQVAPNIVVEPADVTVSPSINANPVITVDNGSEASPTTTANPQVEVSWPEFEVEQEWLQPQGNAVQGALVALMPGPNDAWAWGRSSRAAASSWEVNQQFVSIFNALSQSVTGHQSVAESVAAYQCPNPKITQVPLPVPEPKAVVGLGVMGLVLSGMMSLGKGLH